MGSCRMWNFYCGVKGTIKQYIKIHVQLDGAFVLYSKTIFKNYFQKLYSKLNFAKHININSIQKSQRSIHVVLIRSEK